MSLVKYRGSHIGYLARISKCRVGRKFRIFRGARIINCTVGCNSHLGVEAVVRNCDIGDNVGIAERAIVGVYNRRRKRTRIGNDVMIGTGAIVLEGVKIGDNVWVGAGSVVRSNVKSGWVVNGNPAVKVRRVSGEVMG